MSPLDSPASLAALVRSAASRAGARRALLLDLDGTLADIEARPEDVTGLPVPTRAALERLERAGWSIAVVTGRPRADAARIVSLPGVAIFGSHGGEGPAGSALRGLRRLATRLALAAIGAAIAPVVRAFPGVRVERKPLGLAVHDRALAPAEQERFRARLRKRLPRPTNPWLEVVEGKAVHELRPRGIHKGRVLADFPPVRALDGLDRSIVALGDDRTDEDLFRALGSRGLRIRVGSTPEAGLVDGTLGSPADVGTFLTELSR